MSTTRLPRSMNSAEKSGGKDQRQAAEKYFHREIPLTRAMGLRVQAAERSRFVVTAPVALNYNHLHTAFGGSINAVATLAGYGLLWSALPEDHAHVVIRESTIRFHRPIREMITAICSPLGLAEMIRFQEALRAKGKARMELQVRVEEEGQLAADWKGTFVALPFLSAESHGQRTPVAPPVTATRSIPSV